MRNLQLRRTSRLLATPLLQQDGTNDYFFGVWGKIKFPVSERDRTRRVTSRDLHSWWALANEFYGDIHLMWVPWVANGITDPFNVEIGTVIRLPHPDVVNSVLVNITSDAE
jgi:hypothetical protein